MKKIIYLAILLMVNISLAQDFQGTVKSYLKTYQPKSALTQGDIADVAISSQSYSKSLSAHTVYVEQYYQGIKIYNSVSPFAIRDSGVLSANLAFVDNLSRKVNTTAPKISALNAIARATRALGIESPADIRLLESKEHNAYVFSKGGISLENIPVQLVYQRMDDDRTLKLAWDLSIYLLDASHYYSVRIDAITGELLAKDDLVLSCSFGDAEHTHGNGESVLFSNFKRGDASDITLTTPNYRVFPVPLIGPNEGSDKLISDPSNPVASPYGWHDIDGNPGHEFTTTQGNNVLANEDLSGDNFPGIQADGGANMQFDFPFSFPDDPYNFTHGAITNLFYMNNIMHDVFYHYGFDEASGNFQTNNYGRGGTDGDHVIADAQDGDGMNNANFTTGADGVPGRMQMYLWNAPGTVMGAYLNINNGPLQGYYFTNTASFGMAVPTTPITADMALVIDDNSGSSTDPYDACDNITNASSISGKIAVLRRGNCDFPSKVLKAQQAGAIAVVVVNNDADDPTKMGGSGTGINIPSVIIYKADGDPIIDALANGSTINATIMDNGTGSDYYYRDGDLDNVVIAHEYGHGISIRLTGGRFAIGCLKNEEQMGEGWSDYFGLMMTLKASDVAEQSRGVGTYVLGQTRGAKGLRAMAYSTDMGINSFTYNSIKFQPAPHGVGSVWATMLWDMTWSFIREYGFDPDVYNGHGGNNRALQLVMDGLKLQPCSPGFVDGRDAILQADMIATGGVNRCMIWKAFAARGLGVSASQGNSHSKTDGMEAFNIPADCPLSIDDVGINHDNFMIFPNPSEGRFSLTARFDVTDAKVSIYDMNGRKVYDAQTDIIDTKNFDVNLKTGVYIIQIDAGDYSQTSKLIIK